MLEVLNAPHVYTSFHLTSVIWANVTSYIKVYSSPYGLQQTLFGVLRYDGYDLIFAEGYGTLCENRYMNVRLVAMENAKWPVVQITSNNAGDLFDQLPFDTFLLCRLRNDRSTGEPTLEILDNAVYRLGPKDLSVGERNQAMRLAAFDTLTSLNSSKKTNKEVDVL